MDLALGRLRIVGGQDGCSPARTEQQFCPNNELFERLVSEVAVAIAPGVSTPAHSIGASGLRLGLSTTVTSVEANQSYWLLGTEGADASAAEPFNAAPEQALVVNRLELRKGLPFGLEVATHFGHGMSTSMWIMGAGLKWSLVEGFRTGTGKLPDVALSGSLSRSVGTSQAIFHVGSAELTLSKPFVVARSWRFSPLAGLQVLLVDVESDVVDLTPGGVSDTPGTAPVEDAVESCIPEPGNALDGGRPTNILCNGDGSDLDNDVVFDPVSHERARLFLGAQARYDFFTLAMSVHFDLVGPTVQAAKTRGEPNLRSESAARHVAFNLALGATL